MGNSIFITGATGFVGRSLLKALAPAKGDRIVLLVRDPDRLPPGTRHREGVEVLPGDLLDAAAYRPALEGCRQVIHLAATTGKARRGEHFRVIVDGTRALVSASAEAGVGGFLHVSSIAAGFPEKAGYHYAHAKLRSEEIVRRSGVPHTILRPTIVAGPDAPVLTGLARLAGLPVVPVFGSGRNRVQPVHVDDLVTTMLGILDANRFGGEVLDVGGPDAVGIEELLARIRLLTSGRKLRRIHLPLRFSRALLRGLEPLLLPVLPVTAGQVATFANEGTAAPGSPVAAGEGAAKRLDEILAEAFPVERREPEYRTLTREARVLGRYLSGRLPDAGVEARYVRFHRENDIRGPKGGGRFDRLLSAFARRNSVTVRLADVYAARLVPGSSLRRKLVLLLAILECSPPHFEAFDDPGPGGRTLTWIGMGISGLVEGLLFLLAAVVLLPVHGLLSLIPAGRGAESR